MLEKCICYMCDRAMFCGHYNADRHEDYPPFACDHYEDADDHADEIEGGCSRWPD